MRRIQVLTALAIGTTAVTIAVLPACATLPAIDANQCGNGVLDAREECDPGSPNASGTCAVAGSLHQCRFVCSASIACPAGYGCGSDEVCRKATGAFGTTARRVAGELSTLALGDFDGDGHRDVVVQGKTSIRVNYIGSDGTLARTTTLPVSRGRITTESLTTDKLATIGLLDTDVVAGGSGGATGGGIATYRGRPDRTVAPTIYPFVPINASDAMPLPGRFGTLGRLGIGQEFAGIADTSAFTRERGKGYSLVFYDIREDGSNETIPFFPLTAIDKWLAPDPRGAAYPNVGSGLKQIDTPAMGRFITTNEAGFGAHTCETLILTVKDPSTVQVLPLCLRKRVADWRTAGAWLEANTPNIYPYKLEGDTRSDPGPDASPEARIPLKLPDGVNVAGAAVIASVPPTGVAPAFVQLIGTLTAQGSPLANMLVTAAGTAPGPSFAVPLFGALAGDDALPDVLIPADSKVYVGLGDGSGHVRPAPGATLDDTLAEYPGITATGPVLAVADLNGDRVLDWVDAKGLHFNTAAYDSILAKVTPMLQAAVGGGQLTSAQMQSVLTPLVTARTILATNAAVAAPGDSRWNGAKIVDIDADGALDVVAYSNSALDVLRGTPAGLNANNIVYPIFNRASYPIDGTISKMAIGDSDADGYLDIGIAVTGDTSGLATDALYMLFGTRTQPEAPRFVGRLNGLTSIVFGQVSWLLTGKPDRYQSLVPAGHTSSGISFGAALQGSSDRTLISRFGLVSAKNTYIRDVGFSSAVGHFVSKDAPAVVAIGFGTERQVDDRSRTAQAARLWVVPASGDAEFDPLGVRSSAPFTEKADKEIPAADLATRTPVAVAQLASSTIAAIDLDADGIDEAVAILPSSAGGSTLGRIMVTKPSLYDSPLPNAVQAPLASQAFAFGNGSALSSFASDLDGDGNKELVVSFFDTDHRVARVLLNDKSGMLKQELAVPFETTDPTGKPRAFAATASGELAVLYETEVRFYRLKAGALVPSERSAVSLTAIQASNLAFGDVNGDGIEDMVVGLPGGFDLYLGTAVVQ